MIYTVTFNPALDVSGVVDSLIPNEKSYVFDEKHTAGGNGINSAVIASRLGCPVTMTGFLGGSNGDEIKELLKNEKAKQKFVPISGRTRMNLTVSNRDDHQQTRLSFPGPKIKASELEELEKILHKLTKKDLLLLGGSLPPGVKTSYVKKLVKSCGLKNVRCMVDMPGEPLKEMVKSRPLFIKPNLTEFQTMTGTSGKSIKSVLEASKDLLKDIPFVCVSSVEGGALLITKEEVWFGKIPEVQIHSTVGAGDSMVGAMASLWHETPDVSVEDLLRLGLAASCATLTERGLTLGTKKSILHYRPQIIMKKVK